MKKHAIFIFVILLCFALIGCSPKSVNLAKVESNELQFIQPQSGDTIATIKTDLGDIKAILYPEYAPLAVENFVAHAKNGYYNGVKFHRVIEDFIIQSGDPTGTGTGGNSIWELPFNDEFSDKLHHYTGALSMANSGPNSNRSQFFIVTTNQKSISDDAVSLMTQAGWRSEIVETYKQAGGSPDLDYRYSVFGQIYEGLDIAFEISYSKTDEHDVPKKDILIQSIEISVIE